MLKRMWGSLGHRRRDGAGADAAPAERAGDGQFIVACDVEGHEIRLGRSAWRDQVLLPGLDKAWNDPEDLYVHLVCALDHGFAADLDAASNRLLAIDPSPVRAQAVRSIVLMETGRMADPMERRGRERHPKAAKPGVGLPDTVGLDQPVWTYGLRNPGWLIADKPVDAPLVTFVGFARSPAAAHGAHARPEDEVGGATRSAALYLAEAVHQWTSLRTTAVIPVIDGGGALVLDAGPLHADLCARFGEQSAYLVSGDVGCGAGGWRIAWRLWDCAGRAWLAQETIEAPPDGFGAALLELERRLLQQLGRARATPVDAFYARPAQAAMARYLAGLADGFMLTLAANGMMPRDLSCKRAMLESALRMALQWPDADVPKLVFLSGLAKAAARGSGILPGFQAPAIDLIEQARRAGSAVARLEPLVWQLFGMRAELARLRAAPAPDAPDDYQQWVARRIAPVAPGKLPRE